MSDAKKVFDVLTAVKGDPRPKVIFSGLRVRPVICGNGRWLLVTVYPDASLPSDAGLVAVESYVEITHPVCTVLIRTREVETWPTNKQTLLENSPKSGAGESLYASSTQSREESTSPSP